MPQGFECSQSNTLQSTDNMEPHSRPYSTNSGWTFFRASWAHPRELSVLLLEESQIFVLESSFYRILHERGLLERMEHDFVLAADEFHHKTKFANEMWQTDFTYFKVKGWGWYYLSTVIDDYSRYIIHWELCSSMTSDDVSRTIDKAIEKAGVTFQNPPCLLSDNGPCYIASSLKQYLCKEYNIKHIHGKPLHPQT